MKYRFMESAEYGIVDEVYHGLGHNTHIPTPENSKVAVAEDGGKIVAGAIGQLLIQMGPIWVDPAYKGKVNFRRFQRMHEQALRPGTRYFAFAGNEFIDKLCTSLGMDKMECAVFRKEVPYVR